MGTLLGTAGFATGFGGGPDQALNLDGSGYDSLGGGAALISIPALTFASTTNGTVEMWGQAGWTDLNSGVFYALVSSTAYSMNYSILMTGDKSAIVFWNDTAWQTFPIPAPGTDWHHLAVAVAPAGANCTLSVQKTSPEAFALETGRAENHSVVVAAGNTERGLKRAVQRLILASEQAERGLTIPELHLTESAWIPQREWTLCHDPGALTQRADVFDYMRLLRGKFQAKNPKVDFAVDFWAAGSDSEYMQQLADNGFGDSLCLEMSMPSFFPAGKREHLHEASQLLWNPDRDPHEILRELAEGIWGPRNGPAILAALELIQDTRSGPTWQSFCPLLAQKQAASRIHGRGDDGWYGLLTTPLSLGLEIEQHIK